MTYSEVASNLLQQDVPALQAFFAEAQEDFLDQMIEHIGVESPEVRDYINLRLLIKAQECNALTSEQQHYLIRTIIEQELLIFKLNTISSTAVFTRSLAAEWVRILLKDNVNMLENAVYTTVLVQAVSLLERERDLRSYTEQGLAYSIVNSSNLIKVLMEHSTFSEKDCPLILGAVSANFWKNTVFIDNEEEVMIDLVQKLLTYNLKEELVIEWVEQIFDKLNTIQAIEGYSELFLHARTLILNFMKSFYFVTKFNNGSKKIQAVLSQFINDWHRL
ncbi:DUF2785 domain-containing protein [Kurthia sibirica]|nr:DUF2785 domain-containing protein [Kurthia sibirica]GEK34784.1 membrane protein [Kurthia sibirica]